VKQSDQFEWAAHAEAIIADIFGTSNVSQPPRAPPDRHQKEKPRLNERGAS
jgi:hypothetical protein